MSHPEIATHKTLKKKSNIIREARRQVLTLQKLKTKAKFTQPIYLRRNNSRGVIH
jgi:hypothetical protein